jgi:hypothetical protein
MVSEMYLNGTGHLRQDKSVRYLHARQCNNPLARAAPASIMCGWIPHTSHAPGRMRYRVLCSDGCWH